MDSRFERTYHQLEDQHFWFRCRRELLCKMLKGFSKSSTILDVGSSTGVLLELLETEGFEAKNLYGIDISKEAIERAQAKGLKQVSIHDAQEFELNQLFDIIIASDCLEHLENEEHAIKTWIRHLKPGGRLIVFVPAFNSLWSYHDVVNHHFRRYTRKELINLFNVNDLTILKSGYWNFLLFIPIWLARQAQRLIKSSSKAKDGDLQKLPVANELLYKILKLEEKVIGKVTFPFGVSTFLVAKKS